MEPILPGATIGVLGNGQLGRMLALAARCMGYRVHTLGPATDSPTGQVADREFVAAYDDLDAVRAFAQTVQVVTFEFENVSAEAVRVAEQFAPVRPGGHVLHTTQNRLREKTFLRDNHFPVTPFAPIGSLEDLQTALSNFGGTGVLKTAGFGYDGKGQRIVRNAEQARTGFAELGGDTGTANGPALILEAFVPFVYEASVVAARGINGEFRAFPLVRNDHQNHILDVTTAPIPQQDNALSLWRDAEAIARDVLEALGVVGVLCVEYFVTQEGKLLINELAPRPHNSGHWTIEGCVTSQFEQQLRAVCGLPLGDATLHHPSAMANLLGDLWENGEPSWSAALALPNVHLHLYGKRDARPGRKMGHITALAPTPEEAALRVLAARAALQKR